MIKSYLCFLLLIAGLISCRKENTSWVSNWSFPMVKDQLNLQHLTGDTLLLNDSSGCKLVYEKTLYRITLSDYLKIPDTTISSELKINFPSLNINPGSILSQKNVENEIGIGDAQLKKITVKKGKIDIVLKNPLDTKTYYTIEIPSFTKDGISVKQTLVAEKGTTASPSSVSSSLDLSGYTIDLSGVDHTTFNTIVTNFDMQLDPEGTATKVTNKDVTKMDIQISGIQIDYAQGYFGNLHIKSNYEVPIEGIKKITQGSLNLSKGTVELSILNSCKIMARGTITSLRSTRSSTSSSMLFQNVQLNNPFFISPALTKGGQTVLSSKKFIFNENNSNLLPFLQNFGDLYSLDYAFELNPYGNLNGGWDEVFPASEIGIHFKSIIPLTFKAKDLTFQDTLGFDLSSFSKQKALNKGRLKLFCETNIPINAKVSLYFLNANRKIIESIGSEKEILGKSNLTSENKLSTIYFTPANSFYSNASSIRYVIIKTTFNSVESSTEIPYNGMIDFQLSGDFQTKLNY